MGIHFHFILIHLWGVHMPSQYSFILPTLLNPSGSKALRVRLLFVKSGFVVLGQTSPTGRLRSTGRLLGVPGQSRANCMVLGDLGCFPSAGASSVFRRRLSSVQWRRWHLEVMFA